MSASPSETTVTRASGLDFTHEIAEAYRQAALAKADMLGAVEALEAIRTAFAGDPIGHQGWDAADKQIGRAKKKRLRRVLVELRDTAARQVIQAEVERVRSAVERDVVVGPVEWLQAYATALEHWRLELCRALCELPAGPVAPSPTLETWLRWTTYVEHERWPEAFALFVHLGEHDEIPRNQRASRLVDAADINLYWLMRPQQALELLHEAESLAPDLPVVRCGYGEYWLQQGDVTQAVECFELALAADPGWADAYALLGDACEREGDHERAESRYHEAIAQGSGNSKGFFRLVRLYGRPELFTEHEHELAPLVERAVAADANTEYSGYLELGDAYQRNRRFEEAHRWYDRAVELNKRRIGAHAAKGYAYVDEEAYGQARAAFKKVIEIAPDSLDGYWGMAWLCEQQELWSEARALYERALDIRPAWDGIIRTRIATISRTLGDFKRAETELVSALESQPESETLLNELHDFVLQLYEKQGDRAAAVRLLEGALRIKGETYDADYRNRLGNIELFFEDYASAAMSYLRAIELDPHRAVFHSNLGSAYRKLGRWEEARAEIEAAFALDGDSDAQRRNLALVLNDEGNLLLARLEFDEAIERYEKAVELDPGDPVIQSNLANAWKGVWKPGERRRALEHAGAAFARAAELDAANDEYALEMGSVEVERRLIERYGEPTVDPGTPFSPIALTVGVDLLPFVLDEATGELSGTTRE